MKCFNSLCPNYFKLAPECCLITWNVPINEYCKQYMNKAPPIKKYIRKKDRCDKCGGEGWLWGDELEEASEDTREDTMTHYTCDKCKGTGQYDEQRNDE